MHGQRRIIIAIVSVGIIVGCIITPRAWRSGELYWAKHSAMQAMGNLTPQERRNLNTLPTLVVLPRLTLNPEALETFNIGTFVVKVPRTLSIVMNSKNVLLKYPGFQVRVLPPFSLAAYDLVARLMNFRDSLDRCSAEYNSRLSDIESASDLDSLRASVSLLTHKMDIVDADLTNYFEKFDCEDMQGFITAPRPGAGQRAIVAIYDRNLCMGWGLWFTGSNGVQVNDIHQFISAMQIEPSKTATN